MSQTKLLLVRLYGVVAGVHVLFQEDFLLGQRLLGIPGEAGPLFHLTEGIQVNVFCLGIECRGGLAFSQIGAATEQVVTHPDHGGEVVVASFDRIDILVPVLIHLEGHVRVEPGLGAFMLILGLFDVLQRGQQGRVNLGGRLQRVLQSGRDQLAVGSWLHQILGHLIHDPDELALGIPIVVLRGRLVGIGTCHTTIYLGLVRGRAQT